MKIILIFINLFVLTVVCNAQQIDFAKGQMVDYRIQNTSIYTDDVNGDQVPDLYCYLYKGNNKYSGRYDSTIVPGLYLVIRNSDLSFKYKVFLNSNIGSMGIFDLNKDGKKDILFYDKDSIGIYYRLDTSTFVKKTIHLNKPSAAREFIVEDINKDGFLDLVSSSTASIGQDIYVLYQYPNDSFVPVFYQNPITNYRTRLKIGDFNSDGKTDFLTYSTELDYRTCFYFQKDSGKFDLQIRNLPGYVQDLVVVDNNHDGKDDVVVEVAKDGNGNGIRILVYPQNDVGISPQNYSYSISDSIPGNFSGKLQVEDLNCDGYPEVYRLAGSSDHHYYFNDLKRDTGYSNAQKIININPTSTMSFTEWNTHFADWDGDGRKDIIVYSGDIYWIKNRSINDQSNLQLISQKIDTLYHIDYLKNYYELKQEYDTLMIDTSSRWFYSKGYLKNPSTGKMEHPWFKIITIKASMKLKYYFNMDVYSDSVFYATGNMCGAFISDTFHKSVLLFSYKKYVDTIYISNSLISQKHIDTSFNDPSNIYSLVDFSLKIFPSPVSDILNIKHSQSNQVAIEFFNQSGQMISIPQKSESEYDVSLIENGVYLVQMNIDGEKIHRRFVVKH